LNYTGDVSFAADIQPIFNANCTSCHGGVQNLSLESYENLSRGSINGQVIIPGNPEQSRLIQYVAGGYMPYGGPQLSPNQIQMLINWVAVGAPNN
jgi:mono/diheme cytochrome c family protein